MSLVSVPKTLAELWGLWTSNLGKEDDNEVICSIFLHVICVHTYIHQKKVHAYVDI